MAHTDLAHTAFADAKVDLGPRRIKWGLRNDMHNTARAIGAVERRSRTEHYLDTFDIVVGHRDEIIGIEPQRRHPRNAIVGQRQ